MDEPAANLDHNSINQLAIIINDLKKLGKTVIISEHQLFYLKGLADRYFYMEKGKIKHEYSANIFESMSAGELLGLGLRSIYRKTLKKRISQIEGTERKLTFEGLKFKRGRQTILDIEAMHFKKGEIVAITGNNGSGKTTLVQCISGMLKHNGHVSYCGNKMRRRRMIEKSYVVMQDVNTQLFAESVIEEVGLNIPDTRKQEVHRTLCTLNLSDKAEVHPMSLSGGEKQRVAIASSIVAEKEVLIFDEPTSGLDFKSMGKMSELIKSVIDKVFCVIIVTHDNELIERCCDRVIHLKDGQIEYSHYIQKVK
jgi:energy-coupling factor transport system ATP-binding protein